MCGRRGAVLPSPPRELCSSNLPWEWRFFFFSLSGGPASPCSGCAKHPRLLHLHPRPPLISQEFILFTDQSAGRLNARVCRLVSPVLPLPVCARISWWLAHVQTCYWNHDWYGSACSGSHRSMKGRRLPQRFHNSRKEKKMQSWKIVRPLAASLPSLPVLSTPCVWVCVWVCVSPSVWLFTGPPPAQVTATGVQNNKH